jgi:hypothetical protein
MHRLPFAQRSTQQLGHNQNMLCDPIPSLGVWRSLWASDPYVALGINPAACSPQPRPDGRQWPALALLLPMGAAEAAGEVLSAAVGELAHFPALFDGGER